MQVNGTLMNYYFHCKRQCYLHGNRLNLEDNSESVKIGKVLHEERETKMADSEIGIDNVKLDGLTSKYLVEIKKSDADMEASKWQILLYLKILKNKGVIREGKLEFVEKNKQTKNIVYVSLSEENEKQLDEYIREIEALLLQDEVPTILISFGNILLYTKTISAIYQTHLDQRISFLHEPTEGRFSLSLDLCEVFKPIIVFRTIFNLVNNRKLQVEKHFEKKVNYCILNEEGRNIFIQEFEERIESVFMHTSLKRKVSYRTAIKLDCYKLIKYLMEGKEFVPFSVKEGM